MKNQIEFLRIGASLMAFLWIIVLNSCQNETTSTATQGASKDISSVDSVGFQVNVHLGGNTGGLNSILSTTAISGQILDLNVHAGLLEISPEDYSLRPYLAVSRPTVTINEDGTILMDFEIREAATWDNNTPITAEDVAFTLKAIKNPKVNCNHLRGWFEFVEAVDIDPNNPKKFRVRCNRSYLLAETAIGAMSVFPSYFYDPQNLMSKFTISELNDPKNLEALKTNPRIIDFAEDFNTKFTHDAASIVGCGPYFVASMSTHQYVKLERKSSWWGDNVDVDYIAAYPQTILFKIIDDDNNALMSLKEEEIDVMTFISEDDFSDLRENERALRNFNLYTPDAFAYRYIGMNMKSKKLKDVKVRNALAHLIDKDVIIDEVCNGFAAPVYGPVSPLKQNYNPNLPKFGFDLDRAKELLSEAGWIDSDGDNVLDKIIDGDKIDLTLKFTYPQGKQFYKDVAQILKDEAERIGIKIELHASEWSVLQDDLKDRDFELICLGWGQTPMLDDFKQIWHTSSIIRDGTNYVSFGNEQTDRLIDLIRETMDDEKRQEMYQVFQEMVVREHPYIFLVSPKLCMAISKKFKNAKPTSMRPGYWVRLFQLK